VRLVRFDKQAKSNDLIGNRTRDVPHCSIVPQSTMLSRARLKKIYAKVNSVVPFSLVEIYRHFRLTSSHHTRYERNR
jgi:hypothetical protein